MSGPFLFRDLISELGHCLSYVSGNWIGYGAYAESRVSCAQSLLKGRAYVIYSRHMEH